MNSKRLYFGLIGLLVLLFLGLLLGAKEADKTLENRSASLVKLKIDNQALAGQKTQLTQDEKDINSYSNLNQIAESVVPQDKDQAETVREIVNLASKSGIAQLSSITFPPSVLTNSSALTQVIPVKGATDVFDLQITVTQDNTDEVPYGNFLSFLANLEQNRRTALVNSVSVEPDQKNPNMVAFTLIIDEYIKP